MNFSKKSEALFYIDKNKITFLTNVPKSKPFELDIPKNAFSHLEIVNTQKLKEFIQEFLKNKKIEPMNIYILLGKNTTFEKDLSDVPPAERHSDIQKFLDIVPFEEILSKEFKVQKKEKIISANKNFCQEIADIFNAEGFSVSAITSVSILEDAISKLKEKFELPPLFSKTDIIKKYALFSSLRNQEKVYTNSMPSFKNNRLVILISIFAVLLIILFIFAYNRFLAPQPKSYPVPDIPTSTSITTPTSSPEATQPATPSAKVAPK